MLLWNNIIIYIIIIHKLLRKSVIYELYYMQVRQTTMGFGGEAIDSSPSNPFSFVSNEGAYVLQSYLN